jgi:putative transposase
MARRKEPAIPDHLLDQLLGGADPKAALAKDGLLDALKKAVAERALNAEGSPPGDRRRVHQQPQRLRP